MPPESDIVMARANPLVHLIVVLVVGLAAAGAASAAGPGNDSGRKSGNSFNLLYTAAAPHAPVIVPSVGAGIAPKAVVADPYNVPLIQNAGSLHSAR